MSKPSKSFKLRPADLKPLVEGLGGCIASDKITVEGMKVGYMYRQSPFDSFDSGWCFSAGTESQEFMDEPSNHGIFDVNVIANYDPDVIPFLKERPGAAFERDPETGQFVPVEFEPGECRP
jgi:hypothetical protein